MPAQICLASQAPRAQMPRRLLLLNVRYALTLYFLPLINVLYRPPFGGYAVMFRIKPMPLVSLNEQFRTKPSGGRSRPRQEGESAEWGGRKVCLGRNADFCDSVEAVRCNSASKNQTALSYVFPNEPLPRWVGELLVLLFRDKSTNKKERHTEVCLLQYAFIRKIPDWTLQKPFLFCI